uniref:Uncharacterized protein n=1 Tax=Arundo donax TaxID=35708 RepID=A0A0A8YP53_ARUDO
MAVTCKVKHNWARPGWPGLDRSAGERISRFSREGA